jgi:choline dehydrogenase-like flavoprotein
MNERFDVVVVGSGAGGGVVAAELAQRGRTVLLLEAGPHLTANDFVRWEAKAAHEFWWPVRMALVEGGAGGTVPMFGGRCVGGTTTLNTKVALRAHDFEFAKWHDASALVGDGGKPFGVEDLVPHYKRVEEYLGVRERSDWPACVRTVDRGFRELGAGLEPVDAYTDVNCMKCGSCLQGCPTNAGKSTMNTYIHGATAAGKLDLRADSPVERVLFSNGAAGLEAAGVEYVDRKGERRTVEAGVVVVAAGALNTPQILIRSGLLEAAGGSPSSEWIGRNLGLHPASFVCGLFDEPQDAHRVYPITAHCMDFMRDEDGGFVLEASTIQDPIGFATGISDADGPMWGERLVEALRQYRHWNGILVLANDENNGRVVVGDDGAESFEVDFDPVELARMERGRDVARRVMEAAGAKRIAWTGPASTHVQGTCRMGSDPARSAVDANCESHDAKRLFVGDASLFTRTLSVNPSLTIMALADRLAQHLDEDPNNYLSARAERVPVG